MSIIEQWYNMSPQERKELYETRKAKINEIMETLKKNKEDYKQEIKEKQEKLKSTQKLDKIKKNRTSFNCDIVLRKDFRISPKSKKYFSGDNDIFLDQQGEPAKESYEKDSLIVPNRVLYQKKKIVLTDPKYNLEQKKFILEQIEANLKHNRNNSQQYQLEGSAYQDYPIQVQQNERFLPQINPSPQTRFQNIRYAESSAPYSGQNHQFPEQNQIQQHQYFRKQDEQKYYSPQQRKVQIQDNIFDRNISQKDIRSNKYNNQISYKYNENNFKNNEYPNNQNNNYFMSNQQLSQKPPSIINSNNRINYQREQLPNYYLNKQVKQHSPYINQNYSNAYQNVSQPSIQNNYSAPSYNQYQYQNF
ncbi:hypothetical protein TTHERM_00197870 (macronuclear) [Tetrahymena thermophila SB210]|uniref:Uncharacterized protein n=1 Tax=Tetrahymena thermophila (strain SB210) TaxID=312017 RepID=Q22NR2_TETTS|nr:hypothetical protein TTHERM_00197870 [Tetrahymena thermophila SB210]EAR86723.2 hypothetical protein TTHERM_00197870 [Tetrahymena thermophila SB210]|eukprot:XP_001006968.2 hypothetical protein TTHERM_00197870 [Tetrahymena thermophila SB210]